MQRGIHIVLEGPDASGKKTQSELLVARVNQSDLLDTGKKAVLLSFPDYQSPFGRLARQYLDGDAPSEDPAFASVLFAADRFTKKEFIEKNLKKGNWIIGDRYVESNIAHQSARIPGDQEEDQQQLATWIANMEYNILGTPRADLTILLNVAYELSYQKAMERKNTERGGEKDIHEDDSQHLRLAWEEYQKLAKESNWPVINCSPDGKSLLAREVIADMIWDAVKKFLASR